MSFGRVTAIVLLLAVPGGSGVVRAQPSPFPGEEGRPIRNELPPMLEDVGVDEHLGWQMPRDAIFRDHRGRMVRLGDYFDGRRPVILNLAYYSCPVLCGMVQEKTVQVLREQDWTIGDEYQVVTISIDPRDTAATATTRRATILNTYGRPEARQGWAFLTGNEAQIRRVARQAGFNYAWDPRQQEYAHPAVIMLLTPEGRMARYLYRMPFDAGDVRLGLLEASQGRSIDTIERFVLSCYRYDAEAGSYVLAATRVMQLGGLLTVLTLGAFIFYWWRREAKRRRHDVLESVQA